MVDKMVDVDVPLTMNCRAVNISKHKAQGCFRCLAEAMTGSPGAPITNPQPPAGGFLLAHPEDWLKPLFDKTQSVLDAAGGPQDLLSGFNLITITKCESILDAKGGPQDLLSDFSLIAINPDSPSNNPTSNQRKGFYKPPANPTLVKK